MGKKRVIKKTKEELLAEKERIDKALKKGAEVKVSKKVKQGRIYIYSTYNNTIMTLTDENGNVLAWTSAGAIGFKGTKKSTPYAASKVATVLLEKAQKIGINKAKVIVSGIGSGRNSALRTLASYDLDIVSVRDATPIPHNGCRPRRRRRV
jgi:small subunit ribosomal protein S11